MSSTVSAPMNPTNAAVTTSSAIRNIERSAPGRESSGQADGGGHRRDLPRVGLIVGEAERPPLGEARLAGLAAGQHRGSVTILDVATTGEVDLDRHRRWLGARGQADAADPV